MPASDIAKVLQLLETARQTGRAVTAKTFKGFSQQVVNEALRKQGKSKTEDDEIVEAQSKLRKKFMEAK